MEYQDFIKATNITGNTGGKLPHDYTHYIKEMFIREKCTPKTHKEIEQLLIKAYPNIIDFQNMGTGTMSKCMRKLKRRFYDKGTKKHYIIEKIGEDKKSSHYELMEVEGNFNISWDIYKDKLLESRCLVYGQMCCVSPSMYIFKLNDCTKYRRRKNETEEEYIKNSKKYATDTMKSRRKSFVNFMRKMITKEALFDIAKMGNSKMVVLINHNYVEKYALLFEDLFN